MEIPRIDLSKAPTQADETGQLQMALPPFRDATGSAEQG